MQLSSIVCSPPILPQNNTVTSENISNIFKSKEEFLFVFGGYNENGKVFSYEVLDLKSGIWRSFEEDVQSFDNPFHVSHSLVMPGKTILQLTDNNTTIKRFSIEAMSLEQEG